MTKPVTSHVKLHKAGQGTERHGSGARILKLVDISGRKVVYDYLYDIGGFFCLLQMSVLRAIFVNFNLFVREYRKRK